MLTNSKSLDASSLNTYNWIKVFNHNIKNDKYWSSSTSEKYDSGDECMSNIGTSVDDDKYSRLSELNNYKKDGVLRLRLVYPTDNSFIEWTQTSDINAKMTPDWEQGAEGYTLLSRSIDKGESLFGGLRLDYGNLNSYIAGVPNSPYYYYAIGLTKPYLGGIPAWYFSDSTEVVTDHVELWVYSEKKSTIEVIPTDNNVTYSVNGSENNLTLKSYSSNTACISFNDTLDLKATESGFTVVIVGNDGNIIKSGTYNSVDSLVTEIRNTILGNRIFMAISSSGPIKSNAELDDIMKNDLRSIHWKDYSIYDKDDYQYCGVFTGDYGVVQEDLQLGSNVAYINFSYDSFNTILSTGVGTSMFVYPDYSDPNKTLFDLPYFTSSCIYSLTGYTTDGLIGSCGLNYYDINGNLIGHNGSSLSINGLSNMVQSVITYIVTPIGTTTIEVIPSSNLIVIGAIARNGENNVTLSNNFKITKYGMSNTNIIQGILPASLYDISQMESLYIKNINLLNPTGDSPTIIDVNATPVIKDISTAFDKGKSGSDSLGFLTHPIYISAWVYGDVQLRIKSTTGGFYNTNNYSQQSSDASVSKSSNTGYWEFIEGYILPQRFTQQQSIEYISKFKENCLDTNYGTQNIICQLPDDFHFGGVAVDDTQDIQVEFISNTTGNIYTPICYNASSLSYSKDGTLALVNL